MQRNQVSRCFLIASVAATPMVGAVLANAIPLPDDSSVFTPQRALTITNTNTSTTATNGIYPTGIIGRGGKFGLHGVSTAVDPYGIGIYGQTLNGLGTGVQGASTSGRGVVGSSGAGTTIMNGGYPTGVWGRAGKYGVYGISSAPSGNSDGVGVYGTTSNGSGYGVYGNTVNGYGVYGNSTNGTGMYGFGGTYGVWGESTSGPGRGVYGNSTDGTGVYGNSTTYLGVSGNSTNYVGVSGSGGTYGVLGSSTNTYGTGVYGSGGAYGVYGRSTIGIGMYAFGGAYGVYGISSGDTAFFVGGSSGSGTCKYSGGADWICGSDIALKENFRSVNSEQILTQLAAMPLQRWTMKGDKQKSYHLGPTAQDFQKAFNFGVVDIKVPEDQEGTGIKNPNAGKVIKGINRADVMGVALASIQGLYKVNRQEWAKKDTEIAQLKQQIAAQTQQKDAEIAQLKQQVADQNQKIVSLQTQLDTKLAALEKQIAAGSSSRRVAETPSKQSRRWFW